MFKVISKCPVCTKNLRAIKLKCSSCNTVIENDFTLSKFDYLTDEQLNFVEIFIRCRGSIKEVEKELNISYPTVRAKLDEVINSLGFSPRVSREKINSNEILDALEKGEITPDEAIEKMKK